MEQDRLNPYASPAGYPQDVDRHFPGGFPRAVHSRIEAVIKDAERFQVLIVLCLIFPTIIGPWFLMRLIQWRFLAGKYPQLLHPNAPRGTLEHRFQAARSKLLGIFLGTVILLLVILLAVFLDG